MTSEITDEIRVLQQQLARANYILDGAGLGSWDWWLETNKVIFDSRWCTMLGLDPVTTPQELSTWDLHVHPEDKAKAYKDIQDYLNGKTPYYENLHRMQHANGHWVWILDRGRISEYDDKGKPIRFTGTHFDVTAYKEKEQLSNMIQNIAGVGGWELDAATGKSQWTEQTYHIHAIAPGTPTDKIMGINFYAPHERERITKFVMESFEGKAFQQVFEFIDAHGKHKWVESFGQPVKNAEGKVYKVVGTFRDVSAEHQRILEIEKARYDLKIANERMTAVLDHAPIAIYECLHDKDWTMNYLSQHIHDISGYQAEEFTQRRKTFESIIHIEDRAKVAQEIKEAVDRKSIYDMKYRIVHANGELRYIHEKGQFSDRTGNLVGVLFDISEQAKYQNDLENIFSNTIDMICIANYEGYFLRVSPSFTKTLGYSEKELLSQPYINFVVSNDHSDTQKVADNLGQGKETLFFENRYRCKNGKIIILNWHARPNPETGLIYAVARNVTEERNRENKNHQILDALERAWIVSEADATGKITYANQKFCEISKYSKEELLGQDHRILNSKTHDKEFFKKMWSRLRQAQSWKGQITNRAKDGEQYHVNTVIMPVKDVVTGQVQSYFSIRQDITQEIKSRQTLEEAEIAGRFGSFSLNFKTGKASWSKGLNLVMGFEINAMANFERVLARLHPEDQSLMLATLQNVKNGGVREFSVRYRILLDNQSIRHIESFGKVSFDQENQAEAAIGIVSDITEKVELEKKMEEQRMHIIQTSKLASLGEMAAGIAHEINNPLAVIAGTVPLLSKFKSDDLKFKSKLETITKSAQRIEKIVKGLKKFSRTSDGSVYKSESITSLVSDALVLIEAKSKRNSTPIRVAIEPNLSIMCNVVEIEQVLVNLISNGIDAVMNAQDKWISIKAFEEKNQVVIQITDSGQGISPEIEKKIFQPFFTTKAVGEGTGLGLSISKGILDQHKASISINRKYKNTCFEIRFSKVESSEISYAA